MRILLIHNEYQQKGGEDVVFHAERALLLQNGHTVDTLLFDNKSIDSNWARLMAGVNLLYNVKSAERLEKKIISFKPDVIHVHNFFPLASPSVYYMAARHNIPLVQTLHNYRLLCPSANLFHDNKIYRESLGKIFPMDAVLKGVYRNSQIETFALALMTALHNIMGTWRHKIGKYVVLTEFARSLFLDSTLDIPESRIVIKPNFVEDSGDGLPERHECALFVGRLSPEKGIDTLLRATSDYPYPLKIIGDGPLRGKVMQHTLSHPHVEYLGFKERDFIIDQLKRYKFLVFPSEWYEGMPITILEALSTGTPVIASNLGSQGEMIEHEKNGLLFSPGNHLELAESMRRMKERKGLSRRLRRNARMDYLEKYTPKHNYSQLINIYNELVSDKIQFA